MSIMHSPGVRAVAKGSDFRCGLIGTCTVPIRDTKHKVYWPNMLARTMGESGVAFAAKRFVVHPWDNVTNFQRSPGSTWDRLRTP